jgi:hypothetical protein
MTPKLKLVSPEKIDEIQQNPNKQREVPNIWTSLKIQIEEILSMYVKLFIHLLLSAGIALFVLSQDWIKSLISTPSKNANAQPQFTCNQQDYTTWTGVNIRNSPKVKNNIIGRCEKDSIIHIEGASADGKWYKIKVVKHAKPETDPTHFDEGWVAKRYVVQSQNSLH